MQGAEQKTREKGQSSQDCMWLCLSSGSILLQKQNLLDRHNRYRKGILGLHKIWKTKRWQTRIQTELLATSLVDSFLACIHLLPKWRVEKEHEQDESLNCVQIRLGEKKVASSVNKGNSRAIQGRCTSRRARNKKQEKRDRAPKTACLDMCLSYWSILLQKQNLLVGSFETG